jgi:cyclophilin family peptidyl-prolyl cis-trans isomerase
MRDKIKMNRFYSAISLALVLLCFQFGAAAENVPLPQVRMQTSLGTLVIELYSDKSPRTVKNFLNYVNNKYYDGLIFHRVISGWLIQGGGYDDNLDYFATDPPIRNEAKNGLKNLRGTIAMARHWDPNSAESQFFINLSDNPSFDFKNRTIEGSGYCVFGKVVSGIEVADAISEVETHAAAHLEKDVPIKTVFIKKVELI